VSHTHVVQMANVFLQMAWTKIGIESYTNVSSYKSLIKQKFNISLVVNGVVNEAYTSLTTSL